MFESEQIKLLAPNLQWRTVTVAKGQSLRGWVAGPLRVHSCHFVNKASRPCRDKLTKGAMLCYCGQKPISTRQLGYLPIITQAREKLVVLMCATTARKAWTLAITDAVEFNRPNRDKVGVSFRKLNPDELGQFHARAAVIKEPHNVLEYLIRVLWQDAELVAFYDKAPKCTLAPGNPTVATTTRKTVVANNVEARDNGPSLADVKKEFHSLPESA